MLLGLLLMVNECSVICNQKVGFILFQGVSLHQADRLLGERRHKGSLFPSVLACGVVESFQQKSSTSCLQMILQRGFCTTLWAMNRPSVCHDNQLPITKAVRLHKAIKWWNKMVCCRILTCTCGWTRRKTELYIDTFPALMPQSSSLIK